MDEIAAANAAEPNGENVLHFKGRDAYRVEENRCTDAVRRVLQKARGMAWALNHHEIGAEHFLLALMLVPDANAKLGARSGAIRSACLAVLRENPSGLDEPIEHIRYSDELAGLLADAERRTGEREPELRMISLDQVHDAVASCEEESTIAKLVSGERPRPLAEELKETLAAQGITLRATEIRVRELGQNTDYRLHNLDEDVQSRLRRLEEQNGELVAAVAVLLVRTAPKPDGGRPRGWLSRLLGR